MKKRVYCILATALLLLPQTVFAENQIFKSYTIGQSGITIPENRLSADILHELGFFYGSEKGYNLQQPVTLAEALTMCIRITGQDEEAKQAGISSYAEADFMMPEGLTKDHWAYNSFIYGLQQGYYPKNMKATVNQTVTGEDFAKILMLAMGYTDEELQSPYEKGVEIDLLTNNYTKQAVETKDYILLRNDMVNICHNALFSKGKDGIVLADKLIEKGLFTQEDLNSILMETCN